MRTIRRLYFYAVAFISLEIVLWGMIGLARSAFTSANIIGDGSERLAQALALIFVGVPVFGLHWWFAERSARRDMEERASGVRAVFLYGVLLATLIPIIQNILSLLDRLLLLLLDLSLDFAMFGPSQAWSDNLIAILMNGLVAAYFIYILRLDWQAIMPRDAYTDVRRVYRYIWVLYGLVMTIASVQQLLQFAVGFASCSPNYPCGLTVVNGLLLALVGVPIWVLASITVQRSLTEEIERKSLLRLIVLYFLALAGVLIVLSSGGIVLDVLLRDIFGQQMTLAEFLGQVAGPLSICIPLGGVWAYYSYWLKRTMEGVPDAPRRGGMRRLYYYILTTIGLGATFIGLTALFSFVIDALIGRTVWVSTLRPQLTASLATLVVGLPLWLFSWRPLQNEALAPNDSGDHARRSLIRKIYLYIVIFISVVGGMSAAVALFYLLIRALLGNSTSAFTQQVFKMLETLTLFALMGVYHGLTLSKDGRMAASALAVKHAAFPLLIFDAGDGIFGQTVLSAVNKQAPYLPASFQSVKQPIPKGANPKAVIIPSDLAILPPDSFRKWIEIYKGARLIIPRTTPDWIWIGAFKEGAAIRQAAQAIRQLAEGQEIHMQTTSASGWLIAVYILAGLFGLPVLFMIITAVFSFFNQGIY